MYCEMTHCNPCFQLVQQSHSSYNRPSLQIRLRTKISFINLHTKSPQLSWFLQSLCLILGQYRFSNKIKSWIVNNNYSKMLTFSSQYIFLWGEKKNCQKLLLFACKGIYEKPYETITMFFCKTKIHYQVK